MEAAGVEPEKPINANAVMAHDFRDVGPDSLPPFTTSHSSHIHFNLLESSPVVGTFWRRGFWDRVETNEVQRRRRSSINVRRRTSVREGIWSHLADMSLSPGSRLGSYEVTALIGQGGMGEVCRAL